MIHLGIISSVGALGGGGYTIYQKVQAARKAGKFEYEYLDAAELENLYFSALGVLELTCKARSLAKNKNVSETDRKKFLLQLHAEYLVLGRMVGGKAVLDKTPLEFVSIGTNGQSYTVNIALTDDYTYKSTRACPNISDFGPQVHVSLQEFEKLLTDKAEN